MQPAPELSRPPSANAISEIVRTKLGELLVMALPTAVVGKITLWVIEKCTTQPWQVVWIVIPLAVLGYFVWRLSVDRERLKPGKPFLVFTSCYLLIFFVLAGSGFLNLWERAPVGYEGVVPRNFLAMNWAGDWRYFFARQKPAARDLIVVTVQPTQTREAGRYDIAKLIMLAVQSGAKGVGLDFHFDKNGNPAFDEFMCTAIGDANRSGIPVYAGHGFHSENNEPIRDPIASNLESCLPESNQGHLIGYAEWDGKIRMVPLYFKNDRSKEALSLRIARFMDSTGKLKPTEDGLLQFIKPKADVEEVSYTELQTNFGSRDRLRDKFVLVGERSERDTFPTPYGMRPGVMIHAFAVHSLCKNYFIQRAPWWSGFSIIFLSCYLMMLVFIQKMRRLRIALIALLTSAIIFVAAAAAMYFWNVWVDIVYPLAAIWLLFPLLIGLQRISIRKNQKESPPPSSEPGDENQIVGNP